MKQLDINEMGMVSGAGAFADAIRNDADYKSFMEGLDILKKYAQEAKDTVVEQSINNGQVIVEHFIDAVDAVISSISKVTS